VRKEYQQKVDAINLLLKDAGEDDGVNPETSNQDEPHDGSTTRDYIRRYLSREDIGEVQMVEVVGAVQEMGSTASPDTIRSILQKMARSGGGVKKVGYGKYRLAEPGDDDEVEPEEMGEDGAIFDLSDESSEAD
jgi:hypothetical protein